MYLRNLVQLQNPLYLYSTCKYSGELKIPYPEVHRQARTLAPSVSKGMLSNPFNVSP